MVAEWFIHSVNEASCFTKSCYTWLLLSATRTLPAVQHKPWGLVNSPLLRPLTPTLMSRSSSMGLDLRLVEPIDLDDGGLLVPFCLTAAVLGILVELRMSSSSPPAMHFTCARKIKIHIEILVQRSLQTTPLWKASNLRITTKGSETDASSHVSKTSLNKKHSENADTSTSVTFDMWCWPYDKVKNAYVM